MSDQPQWSMMTPREIRLPGDAGRAARQRIAELEAENRRLRGENWRFRQALVEAHGYLMHDELDEATVWIEQALGPGDE